MPDLYAYARLSRWDFGGFRLLGPGLGNLLFPWARMVVSARKHGLPRIWPTWPQVKLGPVIRRELDRRTYDGLFINPGDYIDGLEKWWLRATLRQVEEYGLRSLVTSGPSVRSSLLVFSGMKGEFSPIIQYRDMIFEELVRITRPEHKGGLSFDFSRSITVHIRLGDFDPYDEAKLRAGEFNIRLPMRWIIETIQCLRSNLGGDWPVYIFSDASDGELGPLLALRNVSRLHFGSALADILGMSRSNVLVVSSTFSSWSAFLGAVPSIYFPGQLRQRLVKNCPESEIEREPGRGVSAAFLEILDERKVQFL